MNATWNAADAGHRIGPEPPHNFEAEQALLGAVLLRNDIWHDVAESVSVEDFADPLHGEIWRVASELIGAGRSADHVTMYRHLEPALAKAGDKGYLGKLIAAAVSTTEAPEYARTVRDLALRRRLIDVAADISSAANSSDVETTASMQVEVAEARLFSLSARGTESTVHTQAAVSGAVMDEIAERYRNPAAVRRAVVTGIADLDARMTLERGDFLVLAGATSMGKSALADNIAEACERAGIGTAFFPLEVTKEQHTYRRLSRLTGIPARVIKSGKITPQQFDRIMEAKAEMEARPAWIGDSFTLTPASLRSRVRRLKRRHDIGLVVVDYIQLMQADRTSRDQNRTQDIGAITRALRLIAGELGVVLIGVSQVSRNIESRDDKRPTLADLRESGSIEQDATHVLFVYREEYYLSRAKPTGRGGKPATPAEEMEHIGRLENARGMAELIIPKQRNDEAPVTVKCRWDGLRTRFYDLGDGR